MQVLGVIAIIAVVGLILTVVVVQQFWPLLIIGALAWAGLKFMRYYRRDDSYGSPPPLPPDHYRS